MAYITTWPIVWSDQETCIDQGAYNDTTATITYDLVCFHFYRKTVNGQSETDGYLHFLIFKTDMYDEMPNPDIAMDPVATESGNPTTGWICDRQVMKSNGTVTFSDVQGSSCNDITTPADELQFADTGYRGRVIWDQTQTEAAITAMSAQVKTSVSQLTTVAWYQIVESAGPPGYLSQQVVSLSETADVTGDNAGALCAALSSVALLAALVF